MNPIFFLSQLLPLLIFVVIDAFVKDVRIAILAAILFAVGQLIYTYVKISTVDWFVLLDAGLITALGAVSIIGKNDFVFKIKPAVIEGVTIIFMLSLILAKDRFLLGYFGRLMPGMALKPGAVGMIRSLLGWMCLYTAVHICAIFYTVFYSSKRIWALVSGPGYYLAFIPIMAVVLIKALRMRREKAGRQVLTKTATIWQGRQAGTTFSALTEGGPGTAADD